MEKDPRQCLYSSEIFWRDRYDWLIQSGYKLRPRYHPDWAPSWQNETDVLKRLSSAEDSWGSLVSDDI